MSYCLFLNEGVGVAKGQNFIAVFQVDNLTVRIDVNGPASSPPSIIAVGRKGSELASTTRKERSPTTKQSPRLTIKRPSLVIAIDPPFSGKYHRHNWNQCQHYFYFFAVDVKRKSFQPLISFGR